MEHNGTVKLRCKANHDEESMSGRNKLLSEANFIEIWSRKDARNRPSLVENPSAEDKLRRAEGKLRRKGSEERAEHPSKKHLARTLKCHIHRIKVTAYIPHGRI